MIDALADSLAVGTYAALLVVALYLPGVRRVRFSDPCAEFVETVLATMEIEEPASDEDDFEIHL